MKREETWYHRLRLTAFEISWVERKSKEEILTGLDVVEN